jgi:hypothetical protein
MKSSILLLGAILYCTPQTGHCDEPRIVTITIENRTPTFQAVPTIEIFGSPPKEFTTVDPQTYQYKFPVADDHWFDPVDIAILWKDAFRNGDEAPKDFEQRIELRIRRDFPSDFSFPIYFSNDRSQKEMSRLEHEQDINQQFEVFFRSHQIASYYSDTLGPTHAFTRRAAKILFYAALKLAEKPQYFVAMSNDAERLVTDAYGGSSSFTALANVARSMYWSDLRQVDAYVTKGDCDTARMILAAFETFKSEDPDSFSAQYGKEPNVLDDKAAIINSKCTSKNAARSNAQK